MQNKRVFIVVWAQRSRSRTRSTQNDLSSCFVHDGVVDYHMKFLKRWHYGDEVGGILLVVEGWTIEGGGKDMVNAVGGSIGHY